MPSLNPALITDFDIRTINLGFTSSTSNSNIITDVLYTAPVGLYMGTRIGYLNILKDGVDENKHLLNIGFAQNPLAQFSWGINVNYIYDVKEQYNKHHGTIDLGVSYNYLKHPLLGTHTAAIGLQNAISFGSGSVQSFTQPAALDFMWRANLFENRFENVTSISVNNLYLNTVYLEQSKTKVNIYSDFKFRFKPIETSFLIGNGVLGTSAGFRIFTKKNFDFNTGFIFNHFWEFSSRNSVGGYFNFSFGSDINIIYSRRMARGTGPCLSCWYNGMRNYYSEGKYYESFFLCTLIYSEYLDYFKNDWTFLYLIKNCYELGLSTLLHRYLRIYKEDYFSKVTYPYILVEEMRVWNDANNSDSLNICFLLLKNTKSERSKIRAKKDMSSKSDILDSLINEGYKILVENKLKNNDIKNALKYLDLLQINSPEEFFTKFKSTITEQEKKDRDFIYKYYAKVKRNIDGNKIDSAVVILKELDSIIIKYKNDAIIEMEEVSLEQNDLMQKQAILSLIIDSLIDASQSSYGVMRLDSLQPFFEDNLQKIKRYNELVRDAYKKKYDPFNIDLLHEDVNKTLRELEAKMKLENKIPIDTSNSPN